MSQVNDIPGQNNINEQEIKERLIAQHTQKVVKETNFPTEVIELPSKGLLYPENHPLASGTIELKYMTAAEEDILSTPSLLKQGLAIDKLLQSVIVTPVKLDDILVGDKNAIMIATRQLGYGNEYKTSFECPSCTKESTYVFNLNLLKNKELSDEIIPHKNEFHYILPQSKRNITFKILTQGDSQKIESELKALKKANPLGVAPEITTRLSYIITSVDGSTDINFIRKFVKNELFAQDSRAIREEIKKYTPDVDYSINYECPNCGHSDSVELPMNVDFFWPRA